MIIKIKFKFECRSCHIFREVEFSSEVSTSLDVLKALALNEIEALGWTEAEDEPKCIRCTQVLKPRNTFGE